ncbi:hypothetical protein [Akkermansia massiliensis]
MAKVALPSREKAKASASFAFSRPQHQQGRFLRAEGKRPVVFSLPAAPSIFPLPLLQASRQKKNESPEPGGREIPFSTARPEKEILSLLFVSRLTALHFPLEIPALNHLPSNRFIQNRRVFQKPPFLSFSSLSLPCPTGLGRQIAL